MQPFTLAGDRIRLEPMAPAHAAGLAAAAAEDRRSYAYTWVPDGPDEAAAYVKGAIVEQARGRSLAWTVVDQRDERVLGTTRYLDLQVFTSPPPLPFDPGPLPDAAQPPTVLEIGATWYAVSAQGSGVNAECKLLLLGHAFEAWQAIRVTLKTDARNDRSRRAIERLGARFEGVRLRHCPASDSGIRDTAYYAILDEDWNDVRAELLRRLSR